MERFVLLNIETFVPKLVKFTTILLILGTMNNIVSAYEMMSKLKTDLLMVDIWTLISEYNPINMKEWHCKEYIFPSELKGPIRVADRTL